MALLGNRSVLLKSPGRYFGGSTVSDNRSNWNTPGSTRGRYGRQDGTFPHKSAVPEGYLHPYAYVMPQDSGAIAAHSTIAGVGTLAAANLAGGRNAEATLIGAGQLVNAACGLIVSAVATLTGSGTLTAAINSSLEAAATLAGSGQITAALGALADAIATLAGQGVVLSTLVGKGNIEADLTPFTELSPQALAAQVLDLEDVETGLTVRQSLRLIAAATGGKVSGAAGSTITIRNAVADSKDRIVATVDANGNRTAITTDLE